MIRADEQTRVTRQLNDHMMSSGDGCVYCGGNGVVVRNHFDGYQDDPMKYVVPATFWVNDLVVPSQVYPDISGAETPEEASDRAAVAFVIGDQLGKFFPDIEGIHGDDWGWGVFYATDSNCADARCRWLGDDYVYDCPGGIVDGNDPSTILWDSDPVHWGAGQYEFGNPNAGLGGGGAGNHFNWIVMDQEQARDRNDVGLLGNWHAECNYELSGNEWGDWIDHWFTHGDQHTNVDELICWVNNLRDLIMMQNTIYFRASADTGNGFPKPGTPAALNWGWNEIPLDRETLGDPSNWDAVMIHLPAEIGGEGGQNDVVDALCWPDCHERLETTLDTWVDAGLLVPGLENSGNRPGSTVVFAREFTKDGLSGDGASWYRWFFCDNWKSPSGKYEIVSYAETDQDEGACVIQWGSAAKSNVTAAMV